MIAAPVGPVGLLCIRRTLQKGLLIGLFTGLGAALADTIYGAVAAFGVSAILDFIRHYNVLLRLFGGTFLLAVAAHTWRDHPRSLPPDENGGTVESKGSLKNQIARTLKAFASGTLITISNPATLFGTLAVVATFGELETQTDAYSLVSGIFTGSALWWTLLSGGVTLIRSRFTDNRMIMVNRITAVALALIALWALASGAEKIGTSGFL